MGTTATTAASIIAGTALLFAMSGNALPREPLDCLDNAVALVVDVSSSMDAEQRGLVREAHADAMTSHEVLSAIASGACQRSAFAYVEYANRAHTAVGWTIIDSPDGAEAFATRIRRYSAGSSLGTSTGVGEGLAEAVALMSDLPHANVLSRTVDVVGDGAINIGRDIDGPRAQLLAMGVKINVMPVGNLDSLPPGLIPFFVNTGDWFDRALRGGPGSFSLPITSIDQMPLALRRKLVLEIG